MSFSEPFIRRPVGTSLLSAGLLMAGALAYTKLPVAPLPQVEFPTISVSAGLPGADPETMASSVATPLERQFGRIAGVTQMTSSSSSGSTNVTLQFDLDRDIDAAARDVQAAINAARGQLPANLPTNPNWRKVNPADAPIMILALTSDVMTQPQMYDIGDSILAQKISQIDGIGQVFVGGSSRPAVRVEANPLLLSKLNVGLEQVRNAVSAANANRPKGAVSGSGNTWVIHTNDQLFKAREYRGLIVSSRDGKPVILSEVATVQDAVENSNSAGSVNGKPAISLVLFRQPGANIIGTVDRVRALMPQLQSAIPPSVHLDAVLDRTTTIRASVVDVERTLVISILLVVLVVFVFLRSAWATIIPSVAVPLSLVGTFGVMLLLGYSLDNLSLMALTISTGFVIDDAIVVIENITRHLEHGMKPLEAALRGAREIGFTVFSMSVSLIAVFIPILLMGGIVGRLFREFAVTLSTAIVLSLVISLTTTPMMCAKFLVPENERKHGRLYHASERAFQKLLRGYERSLDFVLDHRLPVLFVTLGTIALSVYLYIIIPKGFFPTQDTGRLSGNVQGAQDTSFDSMRTKLQQFMRIVEQDPAVDNVVSFTGGGGGGRTNTANMFISLKPLEERKASAQEIITRLRPKTAHIAGAQLFITPVQDVRVGGRSSNAEYQYTLQGDDLNELLTYAPKLTKEMMRMPELRDVSSDQQNQGLQATLVIDRPTAARLGVSLSAIDSTLYDAFGQRQVSVMYSGINQYHVVLEVDPKYSTSPAALNNVYVHSASGREVPLSAFARYAVTSSPLAIAHQSQFPAVTISFNLAPGMSLGQATTAIEERERQMGMPSSIHPGFQGTAQAFQQSLANEPLLVLFALLAVYIVLGILYESFVHPITILSTLPSAGVGGLPLALGGGIGSELRRPLGIAIVGGLIVSQLLTLYTTPVTYLYLDRLRLRRKSAERAPEPAPA